MKEKISGVKKSEVKFFSGQYGPLARSGKILEKLIYSNLT